MRLIEIAVWRRCSVVFVVLAGLLLSSLISTAEDVTELRITRKELASGSGFELLISGGKFEIWAMNDYGKPKVRVFSATLNGTDSAEIHDEIARAFTQEMFGQNRSSELLGGRLLFFGVKTENKSRTFRLRNVRFAELDKLMDLVDSYIPDKYRMRYKQSFEKVVPIISGDQKSGPKDESKNRDDQR